MTKSRLSVTLPKSDIEFLKKYAKMNNISVSNLIVQWIQILRAKSTSTIHPGREKLTRIVPADIDVDESVTAIIKTKPERLLKEMDEDEDDLSDTVKISPKPLDPGSNPIRPKAETEEG